MLPLPPPAAIPGYQQPPEVLSAHATQFYINKIDAANKEHKLEDKGEPSRHHGVVQLSTVHCGGF